MPLIFPLQLKRRHAEEVRDQKQQADAKLEDIGGNLRKQLKIKEDELVNLGSVHTATKAQLERRVAELEAKSAKLAEHNKSLEQVGPGAWYRLFDASDLTSTHFLHVEVICMTYPPARIVSDNGLMAQIASPICCPASLSTKGGTKIVYWMLSGQI